MQLLPMMLVLPWLRGDTDDDSEARAREAVLGKEEGGSAAGGCASGAESARSGA